MKFGACELGDDETITVPAFAVRLSLAEARLLGENLIEAVKAAKRKPVPGRWIRKACPERMDMCRVLWQIKQDHKHEKNGGPGAILRAPGMYVSKSGGLFTAAFDKAFVFPSVYQAERFLRLFSGSLPDFEVVAAPTAGGG